PPPNNRFPGNVGQSTEASGCPVWPPRVPRPGPRRSWAAGAPEHPPSPGSPVGSAVPTTETAQGPDQDRKGQGQHSNRAYEVFGSFFGHRVFGGLQHIEKIGFLLPGDGNPVIGLQDYISVGLKKFLYLIEVDDIGVVDPKKIVPGQKGVHLLEFFGQKDLLSVPQEDGAVVSVGFREQDVVAVEKEQFTVG